LTPVAWYGKFIPLIEGLVAVATARKLTISLPQDLARETRRQARSEGKTVSAVVQDALRAARARRLMDEFRRIQAVVSKRAREKGIYTEEDLERYLET
jgi:Arc/MetJ-type ribon-helix-helix transcriptional regulator